MALPTRSPLSTSERKLRASIAAHESWARTEDRVGRTEAARRTYRESFEALVDPDGRLDPAERARRGEHAFKAHMARLALKSAQVRRARAEGREKAA